MPEEADKNREENAIELIRASFPQVEMKEYFVAESGWDNTVVIVNQEYSFKIPRNIESHDRLRKEIEVTKCLSASPVRIPAYTMVTPCQDGVVGGYSYIPGSPMNTLSSLGEDIEKSLAGFLNYLHSMKDSLCLQDIDGFSLRKSWKQSMSERREEVFDSVLEFMPDRILSLLASRYREYLEEMCESIEISPIHGDLYRNNVLVDPATGVLNGIIDWGDSCMGDPALDFAALSVDFPSSSVERVLSLYSGKVDPFFRRRMEFYWRTEPVYGLIYHTGRDEEKARRKMEELEFKLGSELF